MNSEELRKFDDERIALGKLLDPTTADISFGWVNVLDAYGVTDDLPPEAQCIGRVYFLRAPESDIWVSQYDLPAATCRDMWQLLDAGNYAEQLDCLPWE
jgi:hypothetical protein